MPQGNAYLNNLAARKELLIIESEINRRLLLKDGRVLAGELSDLREQTAHLQGLVTLGVAVISALRPGNESASTKKRSWIEPILNTMRLGTSLWSTFRNGKGREEAIQGQ